MGERPSFIDLRSRPPDPASRLGLPSPRLQYNNGEVPPSLSPLDAFAAQSRMMAKQLDIKKVGEKRISRLPPAMVTKSLSQHRAERPIVFRSLSEESSGSWGRGENVPGTGSSPIIAHSHDRHLSQHPRISGVLSIHSDGMGEDERLVIPLDRPSTSTSIHRPHAQSDYFGLPRTASPAPTFAEDGPHVALIQTDTSIISTFPSRENGQQLTSRSDSTKSQLDPNLAVSSALRPIPHMESSDDDYSSSIAGSSFSYPRKLSSSSGISAPHSPLSPFIPVHPPRSPSMSSDASVSGVSLARPHLNFSRPRSTASLCVLSRTDSPTPQQPTNSHTRQPSATMQGAQHACPDSDNVVSGEGDGLLPAGGSSYTYARFSLPRGRMVSRNSTVFQGLSTPHFEWKEPLFQDVTPSGVNPDATPAASASRPSVTLDPGQDKADGGEATFTFGFESTQPTKSEQCVQPPPPSSHSDSYESRRSAESNSSSNGRTSAETGDLRSARAVLGPKTQAEDVKSTSSKSSSTVRAGSTKTGATNATTFQYLSPEEHVTKAIECHESGSLQESTYHLRVAAMQNHPTAMLLYALACRHGWGMRPNQREGVQWLRKALDSAMLEVAEDEDPSSATGPRELYDKKARRAQFALSIYELGVSHLNGWGIEQDKALALRCFEVAGHWGDVDALTEAGFCYAEGIGCRKDLKRAAKFYRMAEQRGVNMVGNSWYVLAHVRISRVYYI